MKGLVKKKTIFECREWEIIGFNGLTFQNRFAPYVLAFLEVTPRSFELKIEIIKRVFRWANKTPQTLITPHRPVFTKLVEALRQKAIFNGLHIYDALEELEHIQKIISDNNQFKYFQ